MSKSFYEDGELPDDIAAQLQATETEKPKRKQGGSSVSRWMTTMMIVLLVYGAAMMLVCNRIGRYTSPSPKPGTSATTIPKTKIPLSTITPGGVLEKLAMCADAPDTRRGFMMVEVSAPGLDSELIRTNLAGEAQCRLTRNTTAEHSPAVSPDGKTILYASGDGYQSSLRRMNSDGSDDHEISSFGADPAWSPDGQQVAFPATVVRAADVMTARLDDELVDITSVIRDDVQHEYNDLSPDWSPDGQTIVFVSDRDTAPQEQNNLEVYVIQPDGTGLQRLTDNRTLDVNPVWLPDGRIAFLHLIPDGLATEIFIMNADGTGLEQITGNKGIKLQLVASPDGSYLYYIEAGSIYRVRMDGRYTVQQVTADVMAKSLDVWTPQ